MGILKYTKMDFPVNSRIIARQWQLQYQAMHKDNHVQKCYCEFYLLKLFFTLEGNFLRYQSFYPPGVSMLSEKVLTVADVREANTTKKSVSLSTRPGTTVSGLDRAKAKD